MKKLLNSVVLTGALVSLVAVGFAQQPENREYRFDPENGTSSESHSSSDDSDYRRDDSPRPAKKRNTFSKKDFGLYLGLNNFDETLRMPELDTWRSRYVALQWRKNHSLVTGRNADVAIGTGIEVGWNNYMYRDDIELIKDDGVSDFYLLDFQANKAKLVVNTVNVPLMLQFGFKESKFRIGVGMYGGLRINSYQAFKSFGEGSGHIRNDYNLRNFNYGFMAEAGKNDFRLFVKYDALPLFNDHNPVNANAISFGIRL